MRKIDELTKPRSCLNKAYASEMLFVLLGRDPAAAATIRFWAAERIRLGLNRSVDAGDAQIEEALSCALTIEDELLRRKRLRENDDGNR